LNTEYQRKNKKSRGWLYFFGGIIALGIFGNVFVGGSIPNKGEVGEVKYDTYLAVGQDDSNYKKLEKYLDEDQNNAIDEMETNGQLIYLTQGTEVRMLSKGVFTGSKVEVVETGKVGYVTTNIIVEK
jgi:hypothetical protein